jgi:colanic acid/amylovoran biosynthesis glycosyltransferase
MTTVAIFRADLLPLSETFIQAQAGAMAKFQPVFVGLRQLEKSLALPGPAIVVAEQGSRATASIRTKLYRSLGLSPSFHRRVQTTHPCLLHAHFATDAILALPLVSKLRIPLVVTLHGYDVTMSDSHHATSVAGRRFLKRRKRLWSRTSVFLCVSDFVRQRALEVGFPEQKLRVQYIGIDVFDFAAQKNDPAEGLILFVGRLVEKKGCECLLRAVQLITQLGQNVKTVVIGDGPLRASLEALASNLGIDCSFLGAQPASAVRTWLERATVFCVPSVEAKNGDSEGLGMAFLEAQSMGVPVVSFRHGGIPEAVHHGVTGYLAQEGNIYELHEYLLRVLSSRELQKTMGAQGVKLVSEKFSLRARTDELEGIYAELIG